MSNYADIENWFATGCDYYAGLGLFAKYSKNKILHKNLSTGTPNKWKVEKLAYELSKIAGLPEPAIAKVQPVQPTAKISSINPTIEIIRQEQLKEQKQEGKKIDWPVEILLLIKEKGDLSNERDIIHRRKGELPDDNTDELIAQRKELVEKIEIISRRIEQLRAIIDKYEKSGVVDMEAGAKYEVTEHKSRIKKVNVEDLSDMEVMKKIRAIAPMISRNKKQLKELPKGPKYAKLAAKIKADTDLLEKLKERAK